MKCAETAGNLQAQFELIQQLQAEGFNVLPGSMGENLTTVDIDLLGLPQGTLLNIGAVAQLCITGSKSM